ncbi:MAG TPA: 30S ribosomal protein S13 [Dehalococcoidia bacterium]|nr:30S ribosomal protein S13 [Dehalococcoidia bacterium]HAS28035.1 30S ribosomal protein S13 [Dehalococcoidia bacterium]
MARIAGVDIPKNKQIKYALQYIHGIGPTYSMKILEKAEIEPTTKSDDLTEAENNRLREIIDREYRTEGELRKEVTLNVKRLIDIGSYRGLRHRRNLPVHGQRTRTNARTRKGIKKTVAGRGQKRGMAKT